MSEARSKRTLHITSKERRTVLHLYRQSYCKYEHLVGQLHTSVRGVAAFEENRIVAVTLFTFKKSGSTCEKRLMSTKSM